MQCKKQRLRGLGVQVSDAETYADMIGNEKRAARKHI